MQIDPSNIIHPTAIIHPEAKLGKGNSFGPYCVVGDGVEIGDGNRFIGYVSIGMEAEHRSYFNQLGKVVIGNNNVVREFVTINSSTAGVTRMGSGCVMLRGSHLSHDSVLEDNVTVSCSVLIGGESYIMQGANLGLACVLHQRQTVGSFAMIGMGTVIPKGAEIAPAGVYVGNPARFLKRNSIGIERAGITSTALEKEIERFHSLRQRPPL
ncbi:MAG: UDP-N-acetylglucosamine acyltransferase [Bdellovibrionales bacterium]